jgi:hypothetical protein
MQTATIIGIIGTVSIGTTLANIGSYSVPASTSAVISHLTLANHSSSPVTVSVYVTNGTLYLCICQSTPIAVGDTLNVLGENGKITLATGWSVQASCSATGSVDAAMSVTQFV